MRLVLDLFLLLGLVLASPWLVYQSIRSGGWRDLPERFGFASLPVGAVWLHGSSVGEVRLIEPLVRMLERQDLPLVISSHTVTGVRAARLTYPRHFVLRFPFDFSFVQRRLVSRFRPRLVIVIESDLWPNHLLAAEKFAVSVAVVNAKLSERSFRLHRWTRIVPRALKSVRFIAAQTKAHAERFSALGVPPDRVTVTGNMKYDLMAGDDSSEVRNELRMQLGFTVDDCVIIGGSLHPREDEDLLFAFAATFAQQQGTRLVIVPRYPDQASAVLQNVTRAGLVGVASSSLKRNPERKPGPDEVVVVDTLGELRRFYAASDIAFVGGSLYFRGSNKGGHNLMEPAILGIPVLFGPHNFSFRETVVDLLKADAGILVADRNELSAALAELVASASRRQSMGERARRVVVEGRGASERNLALIQPVLDQTRSCSPTAQEAQCRHQSQSQAANE